jgi:hypothetical protein
VLFWLLIDPDWFVVVLWVPAADPVLFGEVGLVWLLMDPVWSLEVEELWPVVGLDAVDCDEPGALVVVVLCVVVVLVWELGAVWLVLVEAASCATTHVPQHSRTAISAVLICIYVPPGTFFIPLLVSTIIGNIRYP